MESGTFISKAFLSRTESPEVLGRVRDSLAVEANDYSAQALIAMSNIEVDLAAVQRQASNVKHRGIRTFLVILGPFTACAV